VAGMPEGQLGSKEVEAIEAVGEYLGAFLALEQEWWVIDGLEGAPSPEAALAFYVRALQHIHNVMVKLEEAGLTLPEDFAGHSKVVFEGLRDYSRFKVFSARLVEKALASYPRYHRLFKESA